MATKIKIFLSPKSLDEDTRQRELILNILIFFSIGAFLLLNIIRLIDLATHINDRGLPVLYTLLILAFFCFLLWLSKRGQILAASWLLILTYSLPLAYSFITWGADLPAALILTVLIIALCGILLGAKAVLTSTLIINAGLVIITYHQASGLVSVNGYWRLEKHEVGDALAYAILFLIIAMIVWLFCREIKKNLERARQSEAELKQERDLLEIKVIERTEELRQLEAEKINQLYRFAEFGRLSSGIFHDLVNPLTAVSLNLEQIREEEMNKLSDAKSYLSQALSATKRMEDLVASIKKQIQREGEKRVFSLNEELRQIIQLLAYKARRAKVEIVLIASSELTLDGEALKFGQIITNLLANAIEACENSPQKKIIVSLEKVADMIELRVKDSGLGIAPENITKVFLPFFSTKKENGRGLGIGLSSTKNIIEKDFGGSIEVVSQIGQETEFIIKLPITKWN